MEINIDDFHHVIFFLNRRPYGKSRFNTKVEKDWYTMENLFR
jgi:hypothetical protein